MSMDVDAFEPGDLQEKDFTVLNSIFHKDNLNAQEEVDFLKMFVCMIEKDQISTLEDLDLNRYCFTCLK